MISKRRGEEAYNEAESRLGKKGAKVDSRRLKIPGIPRGFAAVSGSNRSGMVA